MSTTGITGTKELEALIQRVRELPEFVTRAAPEAARKARAEIARTINAGTDPWGKTWEPKKEGHGKPLVNAASALFAAAIGTKLLFRLTGIEAAHHWGWVRGGTARRIMPTADQPLPEPFTDAIFKVITDHFTAYMAKP